MQNKAIKKATKKALSLLMVFVMVIGILPMSIYAVGNPPSTYWKDNAATAFAGGTGTEGDPYRIATAGQLAYMSSFMGEYNTEEHPQNGAYYVLTADIDISAHLWTPITPFAGHFDGRGHTIKGLTIVSTSGSATADTSYAGLFGQFSDWSYDKDQSFIRNLELTDVKIDMNDTSNTYTGAVVASSSNYANQIYNVNVLSGSIKGGYIVGGIAGYFCGKIEGCSNSAAVTNTGVAATNSNSSLNTGGVVAQANGDSAIINCVNSGSVTTNVTGDTYYYTRTGGVVGDASQALSNCANSGAVTLNSQATGLNGENSIIGGVAGRCDAVKNSYNTGTVVFTENSTSSTYNPVRIAGIAGLADKVANCYNCGAVTTVPIFTSEVASEIKAAIVWYNNGIEDCYWLNSLGLSARVISGYNELTNTVATTRVGTFDETGVLTKCTGSADLKGNNLLLALSQWVTDNEGTEPVPSQWEGSGANPVLKGSAQVSGTVSDSSGIISGATVKLFFEKTLREETKTGADGTYSFPNISTGSYTVEVSAVGCMTASFALAVQGSPKADANIKLLKPEPFVNNTINTADQLAFLAQQVNSGATDYKDTTIVLGSDIDLGGYYWTPIGYYDAFNNNASFLGVFDGKMHKISNLKISTNAEAVGLFGTVGCSPASDAAYGENSTKLMNLTLEKADIKAGGVAGALVGSVAGRTEISGITIINSKIYVPYGENAGGVIGAIASGIVRDISTDNQSSVIANNIVGGVIGSNKDAVGKGDDSNNVSEFNLLVENVNNAATVKALADDTVNCGGFGTAGGIIGSIEGICKVHAAPVQSHIIRGCSNSAAVSGGNTGGIAGDAAYISVEGCLNSGNITAADTKPGYISGNSGGITGYASADGTTSAATVSGCVNTGTVTSEILAGGISGKVYGIKIINNENRGAVNLNASISSTYTKLGVGGIAGNVDSNGLVANNYNAGPVSLASSVVNFSGEKLPHYAGGIAGFVGENNNSGDVKNNYNIGNVLVTGDKFYPSAGIAGYLEAGTVSNNYWLLGTATNGVSLINDEAYKTKKYEACASFNDNTGALTAVSGHSIIDSKTVLGDALNAFASANSASIPGIMTWVGDILNKNNGYPIFPPAADLRGAITDNAGNKLEGAVVSLHSLVNNEIIAEIATDSNGAYILSDISAGSYTMQIKKAGYAITRLSIDISADMTKNVKIIKLEALGANVNGYYEISTIGQLATVADTVNSFTSTDVGDYAYKYSNKFRLTGDLDLTGYYWTPIGIATNPAGIAELDGQNYTIRGLTINTREENQGLFGYTGITGGYYFEVCTIVKNLTLSEVNISGGDNVGAVAGYGNYITLNNVRVASGTVTGKNNVGGAIGLLLSIYSNPDIAVFANNSVNANVSAINGAVGGFAGFLEEYPLFIRKISNITVEGTVSNSSTAASYTGGIFGYVEQVLNADNLVNKAAVSADKGLAGGIFGCFYAWFGDKAEDQSTILNSRNEGSVTSVDDAGGIAGSMARNVTLQNCYNGGSIESTVGYAGGIAASANKIVNCYNAGSVTAGKSAYGIATGIIQNSYNSGVISAANGSKYGISSSVNAEKLYNYSLTQDGVEAAGMYGNTTDLHMAEFNTGGTLTAVTNKYYDTNTNAEKTFTHTLIEGETTLLGALNKWVNDNKASNESLVNWMAGSLYPTYALPVAITYDANGATSGSVPVYSGAQLYTGGKHTVLGNTGNLEKTGENFIGWSLTQDGSGPLYKADDIIDLNEQSVKLYAMWAKDIANATVNVTGEYVYNKTAQNITYEIREGGKGLVVGKDYSVISIQKKNTGIDLKDTGLTDAGEYTITFEGKGVYTGNVTKDLVVIVQKPLTIVDDAYSVTKVYNKTANPPSGFMAAIATGDEGITVEVTALSNFAGSMGYDAANAGSGYSVTLTLGKILGEGADNYKLTSGTYKFDRGEITRAAINGVADGTVAFEKVYDGTTSMTSGSGQLAMLDAEGNTIVDNVTVGYTAGPYSDTDAGENKTIVLELGELTGSAAGNYQKAAGFPASYSFQKAKITKADYLLNIQAVQQIKVGSGVSSIQKPEAGEGVDNTSVIGSFALYKGSERTNVLVDEDINKLAVDETLTVYYTFTPDGSNSNHRSEAKTGSIDLTVVEGNPQFIGFAENTAARTYGDEPFTNGINITTTDGQPVNGGGTVSYQSSNASVAAVNSTTGEVTITGAGSAVITAAAEAVPGSWAMGSNSYTLTVAKKAVEVVAADAQRRYGEANPAFTLSETSDVLVGDDTEAALGVTLGTLAGATSNAGTYSITGTSSSANYSVTVKPGTLTITKAGSPSIADIEKSLMFSNAYTDVVQNITGLPADCGDKSFEVGNAAGNTEILNGEVKAIATGIQFSTNTGTEEQTVTIPVTVTMQNYESVTVNVVIKLVNKTTVTVTGISVADKIYDRSAIGYTGTPANEQGYTGSYEHIWSTDDGKAPAAAGQYTLTVKIPDSDEFYMGEQVITFEITTRPLTVKPADVNIYKGELLPDNFELEYSGLISGDVITPSGDTPNYELQKNDGSALANSSATGIYAIVWTNKDSVEVKDDNYTITKADGTLKISEKPSNPDPVVPVTTAPDTAAQVQTETKGKVTEASVSDECMKALIKSALEAAEKNGKAPVVEIEVKAPKTTETVTATLPAKSVKTLTEENGELAVSSELATVKFNAAALKSVSEQGGEGSLTLTVAKLDKDKLNERQKKVVGDSVVFDLTLAAGGKNISDFKGGTAGITAPYTLKEGQKPENIAVYYMDSEGNLTKVDVKYDEKTGKISFKTGHFSKYIIAYEVKADWVNPFSDVNESQWFYNYVRYVNENSLMNGVSVGEFAPESNMTRAMAVTVLYRMAGSPAVAGASIFTDVKAGAWYKDAVVWASEKGIVNGHEDNTFKPGDDITREQLAAILYRVKSPDTAEGKENTAVFKDAGNVSGWAASPMNWMVGRKIIEGYEDNTLRPQSTASRAQFAAMIARLSEAER